MVLIFDAITRESGQLLGVLFSISSCFFLKN